MISTHAPRTGSDKGIVLHSNRFVKNFNPRSPHGERRRRRADYQVTGDFNPRSPHGERPASTHALIVNVRSFQPTLPARGATSFHSVHPFCTAFQPTLPARGATADWAVRRIAELISTHAPRTGSDLMQMLKEPKECIFQPTLPARGATLYQALSTRDPRHFNPRSPHGERRRDSGGFAAPS